ncbi:hypothetical protein D3C84_1081710 [compost metagenome]
MAVDAIVVADVVEALLCLHVLGFAHLLGAAPAGITAASMVQGDHGVVPVAVHADFAFDGTPG